MQADAIQNYRQRLFEMRHHLTKQIRSLDDAVAEHEHTAGNLAHIPSHPADRDSEGIETTVAVEHSERQMLDQVNSALSRIEQGTYGRCKDCGREIPRERLDVVPHAACCVPCEEKREQAS
jgi:RNA polymerase-binding protein DksA